MQPLRMTALYNAPKNETKLGITVGAAGCEER
jgi:hypothetical protein